MEIKQYCEKEGISLTDFANKLGITKQRLNHWVLKRYIVIGGCVFKVIKKI